AAKAIAAEHDGADMADWPASARTRYDDLVAKAGDTLQRIRTATDDFAVTGKARELSDAMGGGDIGGGPAAPAGKDRRLSFKGMGGRLGREIRADGIGQKALSPSGAAVVSQEFTADPVALGQPALSMLDVIPVI